MRRLVFHRLMLACAIPLVFFACEHETISNPPPPDLSDRIPPAAIGDLVARPCGASTVTLAWTTPGDDSSEGTATRYDIRYASGSDGSWAEMIAIPMERTPPAAGARDSLLVTDLSPVTTYCFRMAVADEASNWSPPSETAVARTTAGWEAMGSAPNGPVYALLAYAGDLIAAGDFTTAGAAPARSVARWDGSAWEPLGFGVETEPGVVYALAQYGDALIAGGTFTIANGAPGDHIASWDGTAWGALGQGMDATVQVLAVQQENLIVGGTFRGAGGIDARFVACWNESGWSPMGAGMNDAVFALRNHLGEMFAGGHFDIADGAHTSAVASWDGWGWQPLGQTSPSSVHCLTVHRGSLVAGGTFKGTAGTAMVHGVGWWSGSRWELVGPGLDGSVSAVASFDGDLVVSGEFTLTGEARIGHIARWRE